MIDEQSIKNAASKNDNFYSYFKDLERCLKVIQKLTKILNIDMKELCVLNEFITIYNAYEQAVKIKKLDINQLFINMTKSLDIIKRNDENKIKSSSENLNLLIGNIKETLYDSSKEKEIKGDIIYYELISNIFLNELLRENNIKYKIYILNEFLLEDERLFIQSNQILKLILEDFISTNIEYFQYSFFKLSNPDLRVLEKKTNNDWIKETLINIFEHIIKIYTKSNR
jgi:hypothetical protein